MLTDFKSGPSGLPTASELRMAILSKEMAHMQKRDEQREKREKEQRAFNERFLKEPLTEEERTMIQQRVLNAVANSKFEVLIYSFHSDLCTDSGRAINNREDNWPNTLQGKAKELYDRFINYGKPKGFKLKATIINFPDGMPGDVGLFLSWAPEK